MKPISYDTKTALLFLCLMVFFWLGPFSLFPPTGWVDPGLYLYWFLNAPQNVALRGLDYHGARLSFVAPGALLNALLKPAHAQIILVSGYFLLGLVATNIIASTLLRSFAARATLLLAIGANPLWIGAFARGYVDGPAMALGLLAVACLLRPVEPPGARHHAAAGALVLLAVCAHTFGGGIAGMTVATIALLRAKSLRAVAVNGVAGMAGALGALLALGLVAKSLGMPFLFFRSVMGPLHRSLDGTLDVFSMPLLEWVPFAPRLLLLPTILGLVAISASVLRAEGRRGACFAAAALIPVLPLAAWTALRTASLLQYHFYASYLLLGLVPALTVFLAWLERTDRLPSGRRLWTPLGFGVAAVVTAALLPMSARQSLPLAMGTWLLAGGALAAALLLTPRLGPSLAGPGLALGLLLAGALNADTARLYRFPGSPDQAAQMQAITRMHDFLAENGSLRGRYFIWGARDHFTEARGIGPEQLRELSFAGTRFRLNVIDSLMASLGWHVASIGFAMPHFSDIWGVQQYGRQIIGQLADQPVTLITLCAEPAECRGGQAVLAELGIALHPGPVREIALRGMPRFTVSLAEVTAPITITAPRPTQGEAVLARLALLEDMQGEGRVPADLPAVEMAAWRPPANGAAPVQAIRLQTWSCTGPDERIVCRALYASGDRPLMERELVFTRLVHLAILLEAGLASPAAGED
jgi:hypothetical protein